MPSIKFHIKTKIMVRETKFEGRTVYICERCGLIYRNRKIAEKCQNWCDNYKSCNLKISKNALNKEAI
mgnify:CR=1 FL=1